MMRRLLLLALTGFMIFAGAKSNAQSQVDQFSRARYHVQKTLHEMQNIYPACFECSVADAGEQAPSNLCREYYNKLYSKPTVEMKVALGYIDIPGPSGKSPTAIDGPMRAALVSRLLVPCQENEVGTCGFKASKDDEDLFTKDEDLFTKDVKGADGHLHRVNLMVVNSSASELESDNLGKLKPIQDRKSAHARQVFLDGMNHGGLPIYIGHGRKNSGADFDPPVRRTNGTVDYGHYKHKESEKEMLDAIQSAKEPPVAIGFFGCNATKAFTNDIRKASKNSTAVAASDGLVDPDAAFVQGVAMLDSHLSMRCEKQLVAALAAMKETRDGDPIIPPTLTGFFERGLPLTPQYQTPILSPETSTGIPTTYRSPGNFTEIPSQQIRPPKVDQPPTTNPAPSSSAKGQSGSAQ